MASTGGNTGSKDNKTDQDKAAGLSVEAGKAAATQDATQQSDAAALSVEQQKAAAKDQSTMVVPGAAPGSGKSMKVEDGGSEGVSMTGGAGQPDQSLATKAEEDKKKAEFEALSWGVWFGWLLDLIFELAKEGVKGAVIALKGAGEVVVGAGQAFIGKVTGNKELLEKGKNNIKDGFKDIALGVGTAIPVIGSYLDNKGLNPIKGPAKSNEELMSEVDKGLKDVGKSLDELKQEREEQERAAAAQQGQQQSQRTTPQNPPDPNLSQRAAQAAGDLSNASRQPPHDPNANPPISPQSQAAGQAAQAQHAAQQAAKTPAKPAVTPPAEDPTKSPPKSSPKLGGGGGGQDN